MFWNRTGFLVTVPLYARFVSPSSANLPSIRYFSVLFFAGVFWIFCHFYWFLVPIFFVLRSDKDSVCSSGINGPSTTLFRPETPKKTKNEIGQLWSPISEKVGKRRGKKDRLKNNIPEKDKIRGTLVWPLWCAAATGLMPIRLPRARDCARGCNNRGPTRPKLSALDVTKKLFLSVCI